MTVTQYTLTAAAAPLVHKLWQARMRATSPAQLARLDRMIGAALALSR